MAVCESCGKTFDVSSLPAEVSSSRLLCAPCYWKRQADKAAGKGKSASAGGAASSATAVAPPPSKPSPAPATAAAAAASGSAAAKADGSHAKSAASHGHPAHDAHVTGHSRHAGKRPDEVHPLKPGEAPPMVDKATKVGGILALLFVLVAGGVYLVVRNMKTEETRAEEKVKKELADFKASIDAVNVETMEGAIQVRSMVDASRKIWSGTDVEKDVTSKRARAESFIEGEQEKRDYFDTLATLEAQAKESSGKSAQELRDLLRRANAKRLNAAGYGKEAELRVTSLCNELTQSIGTKAKEEAVQYADASGKTDGKGALQRLGKAEDDVRGLWEQATKDKNAATKALCESYLQELIAKSDAIANDFYSDSEVEKTAWRDLLVGDAATEWQFPAAKGFVAKVENGVLSAKGPDPDAKARGLCVIGDKEKWRDFVIDAEFKVESGKVQLFFRLGGNPNNNTPNLEVECEEGGTIAPGGTYAFTYKLLGSKESITWKDNAVAATSRDLYWTMNRAGAFGIVVEKGASVKFTRLRIRELR